MPRTYEFGPKRVLKYGKKAIIVVPRCLTEILGDKYVMVKLKVLPIRVVKVKVLSADDSEKEKEASPSESS